MFDYDFRRADGEDGKAVESMHSAYLDEIGVKASPGIKTLRRENSTRFFRNRDISKNQRVWVAHAESDPVAMCAISLLRVPPNLKLPRGTMGHLDVLYTHPAHREQGLAKHLLNLTLKEAEKLYCDRVIVSPPEWFMRFFERNGFFRDSQHLEHLTGVNR